MSGVDPLDPAIGYLLVACFSTFFGWAAVQKWHDLAQFGRVVANYDVLPRVAILPMTMAVPMAEASIAVLLWVPSLRAAGAAAGSVLLAVYAVAMGVNLASGRRQIDCGCAPLAQRRPIARWMLWRNGALAAAVLALGLPWGTRVLNCIDGVTILGGLIALCLAYLSVDGLLAQSDRFVTQLRTSE